MLSLVSLCLVGYGLYRLSTHLSASPASANLIAASLRRLFGK